MTKRITCSVFNDTIFVIENKQLIANGVPSRELGLSSFFYVWRTTTKANREAYIWAYQQLVTKIEADEVRGQTDQEIMPTHSMGIVALFLAFHSGQPLNDLSWVTQLSPNAWEKMKARLELELANIEAHKLSTDLNPKTPAPIKEIDAGALLSKYEEFIKKIQTVFLKQYQWHKAKQPQIVSLAGMSASSSAHMKSTSASPSQVGYDNHHHDDAATVKSHKQGTKYNSFQSTPAQGNEKVPTYGASKSTSEEDTTLVVNPAIYAIELTQAEVNGITCYGLSTSIVSNSQNNSAPQFPPAPKAPQGGLFKRAQYTIDTFFNPIAKDKNAVGNAWQKYADAVGYKIDNTPTALASGWVNLFSASLEADPRKKMALWVDATNRIIAAQDSLAATIVTENTQDQLLKPFYNQLNAYVKAHSIQVVECARLEMIRLLRNNPYLEWDLKSIPSRITHPKPEVISQIERLQAFYQCVKTNGCEFEIKNAALTPAERLQLVHNQLEKADSFYTQGMSATIVRPNTDVINHRLQIDASLRSKYYLQHLAAWAVQQGKNPDPTIKQQVINVTQYLLRKQFYQTPEGIAFLTQEKDADIRAELVRTHLEWVAKAAQAKALNQINDIQVYEEVKSTFLTIHDCHQVLISKSVTGADDVRELGLLHQQIIAQQNYLKNLRAASVNVGSSNDAVCTPEQAFYASYLNLQQNYAGADKLHNTIMSSKDTSEWSKKYKEYNTTYTEIKALIAGTSAFSQQYNSDAAAEIKQYESWKKSQGWWTTKWSWATTNVTAYSTSNINADHYLQWRKENVWFRWLWFRTEVNMLVKYKASDEYKNWHKDQLKSKVDNTILAIHKLVIDFVAVVKDPYAQLPQLIAQAKGLGALGTLIDTSDAAEYPSKKTVAIDRLAQEKLHDVLAEQLLNLWGTESSTKIPATDTQPGLLSQIDKLLDVISWSDIPEKQKAFKEKLLAKLAANPGNNLEAQGNFYQKVRYLCETNRSRHSSIGSAGDLASSASSSSALSNAGGGWGASSTLVTQFNTQNGVANPIEKLKALHLSLPKEQDAILLHITINPTADASDPLRNYLNGRFEAWQEQVLVSMADQHPGIALTEGEFKKLQLTHIFKLGKEHGVTPKIIAKLGTDAQKNMVSSQTMIEPLSVAKIQSQVLTTLLTQISGAVDGFVRKERSSYNVMAKFSSYFSETPVKVSNPPGLVSKYETFKLLVKNLAAPTFKAETILTGNNNDFLNVLDQEENVALLASAKDLFSGNVSAGDPRTAPELYQIKCALYIEVALEKLKAKLEAKAINMEDALAEYAAIFVALESNLSSFNNNGVYTEELYGTKADPSEFTHLMFDNTYGSYLSYPSLLNAGLLNHSAIELVKLFSDPVAMHKLNLRQMDEKQQLVLIADSTFGLIEPSNAYSLNN